MVWYVWLHLQYSDDEDLDWTPIVSSVEPSCIFPSDPGVLSKFQIWSAKTISEFSTLGFFMFFPIFSYFSPQKHQKTMVFLHFSPKKHGFSPFSPKKPWFFSIFPMVFQDFSIAIYRGLELRCRPAGRHGRHGAGGGLDGAADSAGLQSARRTKILPERIEPLLMVVNIVVNSGFNSGFMWF